MRFRSRWIVPALAAAALGLSGCGGDDEPRADGSPSDATDSTAGATASGTTPPPGSEPTTPPAETPTPTVTPSPEVTTDDDSAGPDDDAPPPTADPTPTQTGQPTGDPTTEPPTDENDDGDDGSADTARAISRFETFLHALGAKDVATMCEIAEPVANQMADQGMGDCQTNFSAMADQPTAEQATALKSATVDPAAIDTSSDAVVIPATAVVAAEDFTSGDLGDYTLAFQGGDWFIVG